MRPASLTLVSLLALAASAWAHSELERTLPEDGATLKTAPAQIQLWFSEPIKVGLSTIEVRGASGKQVDRRDLKADEKEPAQVRLSLPATLPPGTYKVSWIAVAQDMHPGKGSFTFRIAP